MAKQIDPVCGMELDPGQVEAQARYQGTAYYFCSEECRRLFEENPEAYVGAAATPREGEPPPPQA
jgi:YHS domain-containing protein